MGYISFFQFLFTLSGFSTMILSYLIGKVKAYL